MIFHVGDNVAYSVQFLKSIGLSHSEEARLRGSIVELIDTNYGVQYALVKWNGETDTHKINTANLAKVGLNSRFSNI